MDAHRVMIRPGLSADVAPVTGACQHTVCRTANRWRKGDMRDGPSSLDQFWRVSE